MKLLIHFVVISSIIPMIFCLLDGGTTVGELDMARKLQTLETENAQQRTQLYTLTNQMSSVMSKLQTLQSQYDALKRRDKAVAFFAYLSKDVVNPPNGLTVVFDEVVKNDGSEYDPTHGVFRAPINGSYHFTLVAASPNTQGGHGTHLFIMKNGVKMSYMFLDATDGSTTWTHSTSAAVLHLVESDRVWVQVDYVAGNHVIAGHRQSDGAQHSHFSGFLIHAD